MAVWRAFLIFSIFSPFFLFFLKNQESSPRGEMTSLDSKGAEAATRGQREGGFLARITPKKELERRRRKNWRFGRKSTNQNGAFSFFSLFWSSRVSLGRQKAKVEGEGYDRESSPP